MGITIWRVGEYTIEYSLRRITIYVDGFYVQIKGSEAVCVFDTFTDDCTNEEAIDKYFDIAKLPNNGYCD